jgi:hypothetical protein
MNTQSSIRNGVCFVEKVIETKDDRQVAKQRKIIPPFHITITFGTQYLYNKIYPMQ